MQILTDINDYSGGPCVLAMGKFDGVHLGHARLLDEAVRLARAAGAASVALTFDRHPLSVIRPGTEPQALTSEAEKRQLIAARGLSVLIVSAFTEALSQVEPEDYLRALCAALTPTAIVCGHSYSFGRGARGDAGLIERMAGALNYRAVIVPPVEADGRAVSSTAIRQLLDAGDIAGAERMLGRSK